VKQVFVIVSRCEKGTKSGEGRIIDERDFEVLFSSLEKAMTEGEGWRSDGICVIVRPNYNEEDEKGHFFREWRSFNGEKLTEVRFKLPGNNAVLDPWENSTAPLPHKR
jgi:hypothetical protein